MTFKKILGLDLNLLVKIKQVKIFCEGEFHDGFEWFSPDEMFSYTIKSGIILIAPPGKREFQLAFAKAVFQFSAKRGLQIALRKEFNEKMRDKDPLEITLGCLSQECNGDETMEPCQYREDCPDHVPA